MNATYINLREDKSFHTIILMKKIEEFTYVAALGYAGGGVYEEFFGKLKYDQVTTDPDVASVGIVGFWTDSLGSDEWQEKINDVLVNEESEIFEAQVEDLYDFMDPSDASVQMMMAEEIKKFIYVWYDEETDTEYETPVLKDIDFSELLENNETGSGPVYTNEDWEYDFMEITTTSIWRLSHHFPSMIDDYL